MSILLRLLYLATHTYIPLVVVTYREPVFTYYMHAYNVIVYITFVAPGFRYVFP